MILVTTLETLDLGMYVAELRPLRKKQLGVEKIGPKVEKMEKKEGVKSGKEQRRAWSSSGRGEGAYSQ